VLRYTALMKFFLIALILCSASCFASAQTKNADSIVATNTSKIAADISNKLKVYPNPAGSWLFVNHPETMKKGTQLILTDLSGRLLLRVDVKLQTQNTIINLSSLQAGYYILTWKNENETGTAKLLKN
jgi:hypothetical protein